MFAAQHDAIKGTTSGTPGTGSFTPNAAASGTRAWSNVAAGWIGVVRYEDGTAWELSYGYWNGTAITRPAAGLIDSSTGSQLSLTSSATAALVGSVDDIETPLGASRISALVAIPSGLFTGIGESATASVQGSQGSPTLATTNMVTEQARAQFTSSTVASSLAGAAMANQQMLYSTGAGRGGFECSIRFGPTQLPTGPRLFVGPTSANYSSGEPSALSASFAAFIKDSTDTNIQFSAKDGTTAGKTDTGIVLASGGFYLARIWAPPGGGKVYGLLIRWDTGDIWFGSRTTNLPANGSFLTANAFGSLNATNTGTAIILNVASMVCRGTI